MRRRMKITRKRLRNVRGKAWIDVVVKDEWKKKLRLRLMRSQEDEKQMMTSKWTESKLKILMALHIEPKTRQTSLL